MAILSSLTQIQKELKTFQGSLLDNSGKIKLENLPSNYIQNTYEVATKASLTSLLTADRNDIAFVLDEDTNYRLKTNDPTNLTNWIEQPFIVQQGTPPIGATYIRVLSDLSFDRLPSETLYDFNYNLINVNILTTKPIKYLYPGTTWKLAVREGDFMRQIKINHTTEKTNFMATQSDQMQVIEGTIPIPSASSQIRAKITGAFSYGYAFPGDLAGNAGATDHVVNFSSTKSPGARTGSETRPVNTSVEIWVRIA